MNLEFHLPLIPYFEISSHIIQYRNSTLNSQITRLWIFARVVCCPYVNLAKLARTYNFMGIEPRRRVGNNFNFNFCKS